MARFAEVGGNGAVSLTARGFLVTEGGRDRMEASRQGALQWVDRAQSHRELGLLAFSKAQSLEAVPERRALLETARFELRQALTLAPIDPQTVAMLTAVELGLDHRPEALGSLRMAQQVAPVSPEFALIRSWAAMQLWDEMPETMQAHARTDFVMAARTRLNQLVRLARGGGFVEEIRSDLADDQELADAFEDALTRSYIYPQPGTGPRGR